MSTSYIPSDMRRSVAQRSSTLCEYCLLAEEDVIYGCEVDHVLSEKHGGVTDLANLAYACFFCNRAKGSDIGSIYWESGEFIRFFNPRNDRWGDHFQLLDGKIEGLTPIGKVTARVLGFNRTKRVEFRRILQSIGRFPNSEALARMNVTG